LAIMPRVASNPASLARSSASRQALNGSPFAAASSNAAAAGANTSTNVLSPGLAPPSSVTAATPAHSIGPKLSRSMASRPCSAVAMSRKKLP
jgi:hypothetical protein